MVTPVEIVSITYSAQSWLNLAITLRSPMPQQEPLAPIVSYSGPPYRGVTSSSGTSTSRLQATAQAKQVPSPTKMVSFRCSPLIASV